MNTQLLAERNQDDDVALLHWALVDWQPIADKQPEIAAVCYRWSLVKAMYQCHCLIVIGVLMWMWIGSVRSMTARVVRRYDSCSLRNH